MQEQFISLMPMELVKKWGTPAGEDAISTTVESLKKNSIDAYVAEKREDAVRMVLSWIPPGSEVWENASITLGELGLSKALVESGRYKLLRESVMKISDPKLRLSARRSTATAKFAVGSAHAVVRDGTIAFASMTGSQIPYFAYTSENAIILVGSQKIVNSFEEAVQRIREYCVPLEDIRVKKGGGTGTSLNKMLFIMKEIVPGRLKVIIIKEALGF